VTNMPELMAWADVAISAGGSTCLELAFMGLPLLLLVLAENQGRNAECLAATDVAVNLGWHAHCTPEQITEALQTLCFSQARRRAMSREGRVLTDGKGCVRVVNCFNGQW
jgi:spore coat polysaccharide biosynthesis predicted glycosyltransferase SpsG